MNTDKKPNTNPTANPATKAKGQAVDASRIATSMKVVGSNDREFAIVDHMQGAATIKLNKDEKGVHHYIPLSWVTKVDDKVHVDRPRDQAIREWTSEPPKT